MTPPTQAPRLTYSEYLRIPELLDQQVCKTDPPVHDELQFILVHQVYELWFKLVLHELDAICARLAAGEDPDLREAVRLTRRVKAIFGVLVPQIHVLETMRPSDFLKFRSHLNPASGFQSVQFREVECVVGLKDADLARLAASDPRYPVLLRRLEAPSLVDLIYDVMRRRGLDVVTPGPGRGDADETRTLAALKTIYDNPDDHPLLFDACEALLDIDEQLVLWRRHHIMMVERHIGQKPGTGVGTTGDMDGIRYLSTTLTRRAFGDLWAVRTMLED